jgi:hypothetical protein
LTVEGSMAITGPLEPPIQMLGRRPIGQWPFLIVGVLRRSSIDSLHAGNIEDWRCLHFESCAMFVAVVGGLPQ